MKQVYLVALVATLMFTALPSLAEPGVIPNAGQTTPTVRQDGSFPEPTLPPKATPENGDSGYQTATIPVGSANVYITTDKIVITGGTTTGNSTSSLRRHRSARKTIPIAGLTKAEVAAELVKGLKPYATSAEVTAAKDEILAAIGQLPNKGDLEDAKQEILVSIDDLHGDIQHLHNYDWAWSLWNAFLIILAVIFGLFLIAGLIGAMITYLSHCFGWNWTNGRSRWIIFLPWCWWRRNPTPAPVVPDPPIEVVLEDKKPDMTNTAGGETFGIEQAAAVVPINFSGVAVQIAKGILLGKPGDPWKWVLPGEKIPPVDRRIGALNRFCVVIENLDNYPMPTRYIMVKDELASTFPHVVEKAKLVIGMEKLRDLTELEKDELTSGRPFPLQKYIDIVPVGEAVGFVYDVRATGVSTGLSSQIVGTTDEEAATEIESEFKWAEIVAKREARKAEAAKAAQATPTTAATPATPATPATGMTVIREPRMLIKEAAERQNVTLTDQEIGVIADMRDFVEADVDKYVRQMAKIKRIAEDMKVRLINRDIYRMLKWTEEYATDARIRNELRNSQIENDIFHAAKDAGVDCRGIDLRSWVTMVNNNKANIAQVVEAIKTGKTKPPVDTGEKRAKLSEAIKTKLGLEDGDAALKRLSQMAADADLEVEKVDEWINREIVSRTEKLNAKFGERAKGKELIVKNLAQLSFESGLDLNDGIALEAFANQEGKQLDAGTDDQSKMLVPTDPAQLLEVVKKVLRATEDLEDDEELPYDEGKLNTFAQEFAGRSDSERTLGDLQDELAKVISEGRI